MGKLMDNGDAGFAGFAGNNVNDGYADDNGYAGQMVEAGHALPLPHDHHYHMTIITA
jgi:hypothetical protein